MRSYFLRSERLGFGVWLAEDGPRAFGLWGDSEVTKLMGGPFSDTQVQERLRREMANHDRLGIQYWPLFSLNTGEHVGCCGLRPHGAHEQSRELGYALRPCFWGQGLAREAAQAVIRHAFTTLGLPELLAGHHPRNTASKQVLEALGFRHSHDEFYPPTGLMEPCYRLRSDPA